MTNTKRISRTFTAADKSQEIEIVCNCSSDGIESVEKVILWMNNAKTMIELDVPMLEESGAIDAMIEEGNFDWQREYAEAVYDEVEYNADSFGDR